MKQILNVTGSKESSLPLIIGKDTVYIHTNIKEVTIDNNIMYQYDEIQYTLEEYEVFKNKIFEQLMIDFIQNSSTDITTDIVV